VAEHVLLQELLTASKSTHVFEGKSIQTGLDFIRQTCQSMFYTNLSKTPSKRWIPDVLHWFIRVWGADFVDFVREHAAQVGRKDEFNQMLFDLVGRRPVTGYDGSVSVQLALEYTDWLYLIEGHPMYTHVVEVADILCQMSEILLERFKSDSPLIDIFQTLSDRLLLLVHTHFTGKAPLASGRKGCDCPGHAMDVQGFRLDEHGVRLFEHPLIKFKVGYYEHATFCHMVDLMREFGDLLKFSSWVIEAANKYWKHILRYHTTHKGGWRKGLGFARHIAHQALTGFLKIVHPLMLALTKRDKRLRAVQFCSKCKKERKRGHSKVCRLREKRMTRFRNRALANPGSGISCVGT
jgi:hypothetical protein